MWLQISTNDDQAKELRRVLQRMCVSRSYLKPVHYALKNHMRRQTSLAEEQEHFANFEAAEDATIGSYPTTLHPRPNRWLVYTRVGRPKPTRTISVESSTAGYALSRPGGAASVPQGERASRHRPHHCRQPGRKSRQSRDSDTDTDTDTDTDGEEGGREALPDPRPAGSLAHSNGALRRRLDTLRRRYRALRARVLLPGPRGPPGPAGTAGRTGPDGHSGPTGPVGPAGAAGPPGGVGPPGTRGAAGAMGPGGGGGAAGASGLQGERVRGSGGRRAAVFHDACR
jgi:hypothetical protein